MSCAVVRGIPEFEIKDGLVYLTFEDRDLPSLCLPMQIFVLTLARGQETLALWHYERLETVASSPIPIGRGRRK